MGTPQVPVEIGQRLPVDLRVVPDLEGVNSAIIMIEKEFYMILANAYL